ncbi:MAG: NAD(P)H-binding protein [Pseudomonadaceae bacterium]|nr:NAD(P)H-binding protein [Pseudomonadaceae bacterium]
MESTQKPQTWMITGANGNLGKRLISEILSDNNSEVVAVVRSARAQHEIESLELDADKVARLEVKVLNYDDVAALTEVAQGCDKAVHLVGILKETKMANYFDAHEASTSALLQALENSTVKHLTYLSIVGSTPDSNNACLASKGRAEQLCLKHNLATCVLRVPMVLGEGDYASFALRKRAQAGRSITFRADSMEQPIYAGDVVRAVIAAGTREIDGDLNLAGPEVLSRRALTERAAAIVGGGGKVVSLPLGLGLGMAGLFETFMANPPVTKAMLEVLDHDDEVDPQAACQALGLEALTPLDDMLKAVLS